MHVGSVRVNLLGSPDVKRSLGQTGFIETRLRAGARQSPDIAVTVAAPERVDVTAQRMSGRTEPRLDAPEGLRPWLRRHFEPGLFEDDPLLVVLSLSPALMNMTWRHRRQGFVVTEPEMATTEERSWFDAEFAPSPTDTDEIAQALQAIDAGLADSPTELAVLNVSTYIPNETAHGLRPGDSEPLSLLANRLDLILERGAAKARYAVIDVDRIVAEFGAEGAVEAPGIYGDEVSAAIADEAMETISALPGVHDSFGLDVMQLVVPRHDRRTGNGVLVEWHVSAPCEIKSGDDLFDVRFDNVRARLGNSGRDGGRAMRMTVVATRNGYLRETSVDAGREISAGSIVGVIAESAEVETPWTQGVANFPVGVKVAGR